MTISASQIVSVTPRVINAGGTDLEITGLLLTQNPLCVFPGTMSYTSAEAVGAYFGVNSQEYAAAANYFLGYDNSFKKPKRLHFARFVQEAIGGALIGGAAASLADLQAVTAGGLEITVGGKSATIGSLDFSKATTQSEIAQTMQTALDDAFDDDDLTVSYNSNLNSFIVQLQTTGTDANISVATDNLQNVATLLGWTAEAGATVSEGSDALTVAENMASITNLNQNWVTLTTLEEVEASVAAELAEWANDSNGEYLYVCHTTNQADTSVLASTNLPKTFAEANYEGVMIVFGGLNYAILAMSIAACIDWDRNNGIVTWAFKTQSGLVASVTDDATAADCVELAVSFYGKYATRNDDFIFFYEGKMIGGKFGFVDAYIGNLWLRNALQVAIVNGLNQVGRVPYTDEGYTLIRAWCTDPINRALRNGVIDPGVSISEAQRAQLMYEIGEDVSSEIMTNGFYLLIQDPGASVRVNRDTPTLGLWYTYGGSVHRVDLPVTAVL